MIYINNPPIADLDLNEYNDINFVLLHLLKYPEYKRYFKRSEKYTILDNSAFELGTSMDPIVLMKWAKFLKVNEIVVPDVYKKYRKTIDKVNDFFVKYPACTDCKYMLVPQGKNFDELRDCLFAMLENNKVRNDKKVIGLNKLWDISNISFAVQLVKDYSHNIEVHKLGCNNLREWVELKNIIGLRSADSRIFAKLILGIEDPWTSCLNKSDRKLFINLIEETK